MEQKNNDATEETKKTNTAEEIKRLFNSPYTRLVILILLLFALAQTYLQISFLKHCESQAPHIISTYNISTPPNTQKIMEVGNLSGYVISNFTIQGINTSQNGCLLPANATKNTTMLAQFNNAVKPIKQYFMLIIYLLIGVIVIILAISAYFIATGKMQMPAMFKRRS